MYVRHAQANYLAQIGLEHDNYDHCNENTLRCANLNLSTHMEYDVILKIKGGCRALRTLYEMVVVAPLCCSVSASLSADVLWPKFPLVRTICDIANWILFPVIVFPFRISTIACQVPGFVANRTCFFLHVFMGLASCFPLCCWWLFVFHCP